MCIITHTTLVLRRLLILIFFLGSLGPGYTQPLSGITPKFGARVHQPVVSLNWNVISGASSYEVVLAQDANFAVGVINSGSLLTNTWTTPSLAFGDWYWKIEALVGADIITGESEYFMVFDPTQDANLELWLKADAGIVLDASNKVQSWVDQSPNAYLFDQVTSTKRPTVIASSFGGYPSLSFTGGQWFTGGDVLDIGTNSRSMYAVGKMASSNQTIFCKTLAALAPNRVGIIKDGTQTAFIYQESTEHHIYSTSNNTSFALYNGQLNRGEGKNRLFVNNVQLGENTITPDYNWNSDKRFLIGAYNNAAGNGELLLLNGNISELIFIDTDDPQRRTNVEQYLKYKYANLDLGQDLSNIDNFCSETLSAPVGFTGLLWSTGATTSSIVVNQTSTVWLAGTDALGFVWHDTIQLTFPTIPNPVNNAICAGSVNTWSADLGPGFTYLWSTGETTPSIDISTPGTYNVTVFDGFGCSKNSGDFTFTIDNYPITTTLGTDSIMCTGNTIALQVGAGETVDYFWNGDVTAGQEEFWVVDTTGNYFLEAVNVNGCVARDTIGVTIIGTAPIADFSLANFCHQDVMTATDLSTSAGGDPILSWSWDFGDGNLSSAQNAQNTYLVPGTYTVELFVEAQSGCTELKSESIDIRALPTASFTSSGVCDNALTQFSDLSVQGDGTINGWFWNFGQPGGAGPNTSVIQDPSKDYGTPGTYNVYLQVTDDYGCQDDTTVSITINEAPQTQFTLGSACENSTITITNTSSIGSPNTIQNYLWDFGDGTFSILPTPSKTYPNFGWQTITLTSTANNGCTDIEQQQVLIHAIPVQTFVHGPSCVGSYTELSDQSVVATGSVAQTSWELDLVDNLQGTTTYYSFTSEGSHNVEMTTISDFGCSATATYIFNVGPELSAEWSSSPTTIVAGVPVQFSYDGSGAGYWDWDLGNGEHSFFTNPVYTYSDNWADSTINLSLYVTNADGCEDTVSYTYLIERATYDLAVEQIYLNESNGFMNVGVRLHNLGTSLIDSVDVVLKFKNGFSIMERYPQVLQSGESVIMVFDALSSAFISVQDNEQDWICAEGTPYTYLNLIEDDLENNLTCLNREGELPVLIGPNPNPAMDHFDFEMLITAESTIDLSMIDARGRLVKHFAVDQNYSPGLYSFHVPLDTVESGVYFLRLISEEKKILRKLLVANY